MEVEKSENKWILVPVYEMIGTALFIYCILVSHSNPLAVVVGLFTSIIIFGGITGGHFNPAVSIGVYLSNGKYMSQLLFLIMIIIGQLIGACLGFGLAFLSLYDTSHDQIIPESHVPKLCPTDKEENAEGILVKGCDNLDGAGFKFDFQTFWT